MKPLPFLLSTLMAFSAAACSQDPPEQVTPQADTAGGPVWRNVTVDEADRLLKQNKAIVVLDVRRADEFTAGHIPGARNLDFYDDNFRRKLAELDRNTSYLIHCQSGGRSGKTEKLMKELQFKSVLHLNEGFGQWQRSGKPVEK
jgi:rhodanese-related sulfurtransferase